MILRDFVGRHPDVVLDAVVNRAEMHPRVSQLVQRATKAPERDKTSGGTNGPIDPALAARARTDLIDFLYAQSASGRLTPVFVFCVCFALFFPYVSWWTLPLILAFQVGGTALGEVLRRRHAQLTPDADREPWARGYMLVSAICGVSWGLVGVLWLIPEKPELQVVLVIVLIAGVTGSLVSRSPHLPSLYAFSVALGAPFIGVQLTMGTYGIAIAVLALLFAYSMLGWARGLNRMYVREAAARLRSNDLVQAQESARDVAEARAEEAIEARHAAEAGARAKTEFLSTISHEVRTPLNGIQGMAELMQDTSLSDSQQDCLTTIRESADNLGIILDDIIDMSLHESGSVDYDRVPYDPRVVASQIIGIHEPEARRKDLQINLVVLPEVSAQVVGDDKRCRQALLNLVGNAVKFTDNGKVSIKLSIELAPELGADVLRYAVRDTGIGIAPSSLPNLFTEFVQVDQSITRRHGGRGLGLALVKRIVEQMGGTVGVRSTQGEGSEFWFDVPLSEKASAGGADTKAQDKMRTIVTSKITDLENTLGDAKAHEIVEACLDAVWTLAEAIESARRIGDMEAIDRAAHDLKSTAGNIGLSALEARAGAIEAAVRCSDGVTALEQASLVAGETAMAQTDLVASHPQIAHIRPIRGRSADAVSNKGTQTKAKAS